MEKLFSAFLPLVAEREENEEIFDRNEGLRFSLFEKTVEKRVCLSFSSSFVFSRVMVGPTLGPSDIKYSYGCPLTIPSK